MNAHWVPGLGLVLGFEMKNKVPGFKELSQMREANDQASRKSEV